MANGITGGIENILGLDTTAGTAELQQAIAALQAVGVPNAAQLSLPELQKYVSAGVLSPSQYQAIQEDPQAYQQAFNQAQDNTGKNAQSAALQQLGGIVQAGGSTPINQANLMNNINTTNQAMQGARQGIEENAQERGVAGGGQEFLSKLMNEQNNAQTANTGAVNAASNNAQLALQALSNQGNLGTSMQGQANQSQQAQAQAAAQIAQYNSQLQSAANQYNTQNANSAQAANLQNAQNISGANTGLANQRTEYNAQVPQTVYNDQMGKAGAMANAYGNMGNLKQQQAASQNQFTGSLLGAGAGLAGDYMLGQGLEKSGAMTSAPQAPKNYNDNPYGNYAYGGETNPKHETLAAMENNPSAGFCQGGTCYAIGGEVHDHELCMKLGGPVPGQDQVPGDSTQNDTVPAKLSPHEIVLPKTVAQAPNAPEAAAQFVQGVKQNGGQPPMGQPQSLDFSAILKQLEANGLELRLAPKGV